MTDAPSAQTFLRRPQAVEAMQVQGKDSILHIALWLVNGHNVNDITLYRTSVGVGLPPNLVRARRGDWLVFDIHTKKVAVVPDDTFNALYDPAGDVNDDFKEWCSRV